MTPVAHGFGHNRIAPTKQPENWVDRLRRLVGGEVTFERAVDTSRDFDLFAPPLEQIKALLRNEWDPIGLMPHLPRDEYDRYALAVWDKLNAGASVDEVAAYLDGVAMAGPPNPERERSVAERAYAIAHSADG